VPRHLLDLPAGGPDHQQARVALAVRTVAGGSEQQRRPQREDVGGRRDRLAPGLLGGHEPRGPDHHPGHGEAVGLVAAEGDAEVGQAGLAPVVEQDVGRLDVAVHDAGPVRRRQRPEEAQRLALDLVGGRRAVLGDPLGQAAARQVRHHQDDLVALVDHVEQSDHVGVVQAPQHLGLAQEPLAGARDVGGRALQRQPLERDLLAVRVAGEVDDPHAAAAEAGDQVIGQGGRRGRGRAPLERLRRAARPAGRDPGGWAVRAGRVCVDAVVGGRSPDRVFVVTETRALDEVISEALAVIDRGLGALGHRELVSSNEVADLLLDVRTLLAQPASAGERDDAVPVG
jgi:hypothetical protein